MLSARTQNSNNGEAAVETTTSDFSMLNRSRQLRSLSKIRFEQKLQKLVSKNNNTLNDETLTLLNKSITN